MFIVIISEIIIINDKTIKSTYSHLIPLVSAKRKGRRMKTDFIFPGIII